MQNILLNLSCLSRVYTRFCIAFCFIYIMSKLCGLSWLYICFFFIIEQGRNKDNNVHFLVKLSYKRHLVEMKILCNYVIIKKFQKNPFTKLLYWLYQSYCTTKCLIRLDCGSCQPIFFNYKERQQPLRTVCRNQ